MSETTNKIAERVNNFVQNMGEECPICKKNFKPEFYNGKCRGYTWHLYYSGSLNGWGFSLFRHKKEIWYTRDEGEVDNVLLTALEELNSGKWKKNKED
jgi:hypothetical protein